MRKTATAAAVGVCLTAVLAAAPCPAQDDVVPGARLRVTAPTFAAKPIVGTLVEATEREVVLRVSATGETPIPRTAITRLEWGQGRQGHAVTGLLIGAVAGAAVLVALDAQDPETGTGQEYLVVGAVGAGLGALTGAGVGALVRTQRWTELPSTSLRVGLSPVPGHGVGLRLAWTW
jgi:hypothetical protein